MGATHTKDGVPRSMLARVLDPNGLVLEETGDWKSGSVEQTGGSIAELQVENPSPAQCIAVDIPLSDTKDLDEPGAIFEPSPAEPPTTIIEEGILRIAPPTLARWLADRPEVEISGEQLYVHRRAQSMGEGEGLVNALHHRVKSITKPPMSSPKCASQSTSRPV